jgi:hypothetical protein
MATGMRANATAHGSAYGDRAAIQKHRRYYSVVIIGEKYVAAAELHYRLTVGRGESSIVSVHGVNFSTQLTAPAVAQHDGRSTM